MFDQGSERNPSDGLRAQFYDISVADNLTFDESSIRYSMQTPNAPNRSFKFNMGTKRTQLISQDSFKNLGKSLPEFHCEKVQIDVRDGT